MRRTAFLLVALALGASCSDGGSSAAVTVTMAEGQRFTPTTAIVQAGTTITFVNESSEAHTVTAREGVPAYFASGGFESEEEARDNLADALVGQEGTYEVTFDEPGTYEYFCIPHEQQGMRATIEVEG
jgi:plastocyanin